MSERFEASDFPCHSFDRYRVMDPSFSPKSSCQKVASWQQIQRVNTSKFLFLALASSDTLSLSATSMPIHRWLARSQRVSPPQWLLSARARCSTLPRKVRWNFEPLWRRPGTVSMFRSERSIEGRWSRFLSAFVFSMAIVFRLLPLPLLLRLAAICQDFVSEQPDRYLPLGKSCNWQARRLRQHWRFKLVAQIHLSWPRILAKRQAAQVGIRIHFLEISSPS